MKCATVRHKILSTGNWILRSCIASLMKQLRSRARCLVQERTEPNPITANFLLTTAKFPAKKWSSTKVWLSSLWENRQSLFPLSAVMLRKRETILPAVIVVMNVYHSLATAEEIFAEKSE